MVESELDVEKVEYSGISYTRSEHQASGLRREPSFSGWCDEDGNVFLDHQLRSVDGSVPEDSDFELPILNRERLGKSKSQARRILLQSGGTMDDKSSQFWEKGSDKYAPFDVEKRSAGEVNDNEALKLNGDDVGLPQVSDRTLSIANILKTLFFVLVWYIFSLFLTLYNKSLLGDDLGNFPAPLLMNTVHFGLQAILSRFITWVWSERFQPSIAMSWKDYWVRVVPTALGTAMDVNLSNASLVSISVTFATMCKSGAPIFLLLFAFAFRLENPSVKLSGIILIISIGILLTVSKETHFEFWGFLLVMLAAVMSGFRWCMTQILLQKEVYGLKNPLTLMSYVTPVMTFATAFLSLVLDPWDEFRKNDYFNNPWHITRSCLLMLFGGILAFFMVLTEYILVSVTSAVTVTIAGVVKEAITILVAVLYFHDEFTWMKGAGLVTIIVGVSLFNWYKYEKLRKGQTGEANSDSNSPAKYVILEEMDEQGDQS